MRHRVANIDLRADDRLRRPSDPGAGDGQAAAAAVRATRDSNSARDILLETPSYKALRSPRRYVTIEHSTNEQEL